MADDAAPRCEAHGEATRIRCIECDAAICPRCLVRTEVGHKCRSCASRVPGTRPSEDATHGEPRAPRPAAPSPWWRRRSSLLVGAGGLVLLVVAALLIWGPVTAPDGQASLEPIGHWEDVTELDSIRGTAVAVRLEDGRVLAAGGGVGALALDGAEVFDPGSGRWSSTGSLQQARRGHRAALLDDGRVLVAGGIADGRLLASAEIYDPATGSWSRVAPMSTPRLAHTLTALRDGRVLAVGGTTPGGTTGAGGGQTISPSPSAEIYDPDTDSWQATGKMSTGRFEHTATMLDNGRVLVVGGLGGEAVEGRFPPQASAEVYDPAVGAFTRAADPAEARTNHAATRLEDGRTLIVGGLGGEAADRSLRSAEIYDPGQGDWSTIEALRQGRAGATATLLDDGNVLVTGGETVRGGTRRSLDSAELWLPGAGQWRFAGQMGCPRSEHVAVRVGPRSVLAVAGDAAFPGEPPLAQGCVARYVGARSAQ